MSWKEHAHVVRLKLTKLWTGRHLSFPTGNANPGGANNSEYLGRPRGAQHVRAACTRELHAPSKQLIVLRPVRRSWGAVGRGWDLDESQNCCVNRRIITYSREGAGLSPCLSHATWLTNRSHPVKQDYH